MMKTAAQFKESLERMKHLPPFMPEFQTLLTEMVDTIAELENQVKQLNKPRGGGYPGGRFTKPKS